MNSKSAKLKRKNSKKTRSKKSYRRRTRCLKSRKDKSKRKRRIMKGGDYGLSPDIIVKIQEKVNEYKNYVPPLPPQSLPDISHMRDPSILNEEDDHEYNTLKDSTQDNFDLLTSPLMRIATSRNARKKKEIDRLVNDIMTEERIRGSDAEIQVRSAVTEKFNELLNEKEKMIN